MDDGRTLGEEKGREVMAGEKQDGSCLIEKNERRAKREKSTLRSVRIKSAICARGEAGE